MGHREPTPILVQTETTDPNPAVVAVNETTESPLKTGADLAGWLRAIIGLAVGMFLAGGAAYTAMSRVETKTEASAREARIKAEIAPVRNDVEALKTARVLTDERYEWLRKSSERQESKIDKLLDMQNELQKSRRAR